MAAGNAHEFRGVAEYPATPGPGRTKIAPGQHLRR